MRRCRIAAGIVSLLLFAPVNGFSQAITLGQIDNFEDGTLAGWQVGSSGIPPNNQSFGGAPSRFLQNLSDGTGANGKQVVFNRGSSWTGDYATVGVTSLLMDLNNLAGGNELSMRVAISNASGESGTWWATTDPFTLAPSSGWQTARFGLTATDLTLVQGTGTLNAVLSSVSEIRVLHSLTPDFRGTEVGAASPNQQFLGIDNITAVPESGTLSLSILGVLSGAVVRRRRR